MKKILFSTLFFLISAYGQAMKVQIDGLIYELSGLYAEVISVAEGNTNTFIQVPSTVIYEGLSYSVNKIGDKCFVNRYRRDKDDTYAWSFIDGKSSYVYYLSDSWLSSSSAAKANSYVKEISLPPSIESIGDYAFSNPQIEKVSFADDIKIKSISYGAFAYSNVANIILPNQITAIESRAFMNTKLTHITIPASVFKMSDCFKDCSLLRQIIYLGANSPINWTATSITFVPNKSKYGIPGYSINSAVITEMITFTDNLFSYTGQAPTTSWTNNVDGYEASFTMPVLQSEVGNHDVIIPVTFTRGEESFTANIPYSYAIDPVRLKAKVSNISRFYGEANPEFNISYTGFLKDDDESVIMVKPTVTTTATAMSPVGTYPITISGGEAKNYMFEYEQGELIINKALLSIQVLDSEKMYGSNNPPFKLGYSGLKNDETEPEWVMTPQFLTEATIESGVGTYAITVSCEPKNYTIANNTSGTLIVTKAPLTIKANNATMEYCGTMPTYTYSYAGFVNGDDSSALLTLPSIITEVTAASNAGTYTITPVGAVSDNYDITYTSGTLTVIQRPLVVMARSTDKAYGDENPAFIIEYSGFVNNESKDVLDVEPTVSTTATAQSNAGTYDLRVSGGHALNYSLKYQNGQLTVTPRLLNVSVGDYERPYGQNNPDFDIIYEGFAGNDTNNSLSTKPIVRTTATKTSNVGIYDLEVTGGYSPNYTFAYRSGKLNIVKAEQEFEWEQDLSSLEIGSQIELQAHASSGLPVTYMADNNDIVEIYRTGSKTYMECKSAGTFNLMAVQAGNDNYYSTQHINKKVTIVGEMEDNPILFIRQADYGGVSIRVNNGSRQTLTIYVLADGWKIHSVTFNNEDVTHQLDSDNTFITPEIFENSLLSVVYEQGGSNEVQNVNESSVKIQGMPYGVRVSGTDVGDVLQIYTADGILYKTMRAKGQVTEVPLLKNNIYIIKVGGKITKLSL